MESLIFAILIGLVGMIFNRFGNKQTKDTKGSTPKQIGYELEQPMKPTPDQVEKVKEVITEKTSTFIDRKKEADKRFNELEKQETITRNRTINRTEKKEVKPVDVQLHSFTKDDFVKGIVLSEILGPPRAKKRTHRG
ncbi:hypothetical protein JOC86_001262 [Bacillus pakistanensis]|uniref:Uncharacterized protein n=1 Tax=Rossellomorea pakistanensis TaxID=992288 RepID=A0ABS2NA70_9BACI|nr:hypothetical protein [Bacillus pakistanensis]MBM7584725.1 hypothetical protein [Bacillus pakistanensis]